MCVDFFVLTFWVPITSDANLLHSLRSLLIPIHCVHCMVTLLYLSCEFPSPLKLICCICCVVTFLHLSCGPPPPLKPIYHTCRVCCMVTPLHLTLWVPTTIDANLLHSLRLQCGDFFLLSSCGSPSLLVPISLVLLCGDLFTLQSQPSSNINRYT